MCALLHFGTDAARRLMLIATGANRKKLWRARIILGGEENITEAGHVRRWHIDDMVLRVYIIQADCFF